MDVEGLAQVWSFRCEHSGRGNRDGEGGPLSSLSPHRHRHRRAQSPSRAARCTAQSNLWLVVVWRGCDCWRCLFIIDSMASTSTEDHGSATDADLATSTSRKRGRQKGQTTHPVHDIFIWNEDANDSSCTVSGCTKKVPVSEIKFYYWYVM